MFWADRIAKDIIHSGKYKPFWVDDMFTPSGFAHIGSLRGPIVHDLIYRSLIDAGQKPTFTYVFNDFDPIDGLPLKLQKNFSKYLGFPLRTAPSPDGKAESFAHYFSNDFKSVLSSLGVGAEYLSSWDMYHEGKFNEVIRIALDYAKKIQDIYQRVSGSKKWERGWLPLQIICEECQKLGTTRVHKWDGNKVEYICEPKMVTWAVGCGYKGKISPFDGNGKLPWKVDWPAHWAVLGVTIEGAGKDHSSAGGSRDIARALCEEVFYIHDPYNLPYEFFLIGGRKMSSSKGLGLKASDLTNLFPSSVGRFLFTRTDYRQAVEFDLSESFALSDLFDEYDRCWKAYLTGEDEQLARIFELSQIGNLPEKSDLFIPRFRDVANYLQQPNIDLKKKFQEIKGSILSEPEIELLQERGKYARYWIANFAPSEYKVQMSRDLPVQASNLSKLQLEFLRAVINLLEKETEPESLQLALYNTSKQHSLDSKQAFAAIYTAIIGKSHGPKAAWFLLQYPRKEIIKRFQDAIYSSSEVDNSTETKSSRLARTIELKTISRNDLFSIDKEVKKRYPSVSIGIALIKNVKVDHENAKLEKEKDLFLKHISGLTTETLGKYPEIMSYRKLYKQMGIDWHSRRPSPEALLRRVALGKGLYTVNTCVDAYNLIVMKYRVSVGAFDADQIKFPTVLRYVKEADQIHLLGDKKPTSYSSKELAYYDQIGGYNIDFNFRDAQRTRVTEKTKNLWINVDGVYDITAEQVYQSLQESVELIVKYCGGKVELEGIVH